MYFLILFSSHNLLTIYDGNDIMAPILGTFCGTEVPELLESNSNEILIHFTPGIDPKENTFNLFYQGSLKKSKYPMPIITDTHKNCGEMLKLPPAGLILSPGYPGNYTNDLDCEWTIQSPPNTTILIKIFEMDIEMDIENESESKCM